MSDQLWIWPSKLHSLLFISILAGMAIMIFLPEIAKFKPLNADAWVILNKSFARTAWASYMISLPISKDTILTLKRTNIANKPTNQLEFRRDSSTGLTLADKLWGKLLLHFICWDTNIKGTTQSGPRFFWASCPGNCWLRLG